MFRDILWKPLVIRNHNKCHHQQCHHQHLGSWGRTFTRTENPCPYLITQENTNKIHNTHNK